ncbi:MAG: T9SS type A sorting domain-containing protein [Ignavibacteriae bacterium]|nr:T9SS type A sorting domain-containing protein [Ignavibacteriota bacterium]MCB9215022.1 T9SS type A sorting domain-containing protein [Ignavibacteria bacterium]
MKTLSIPYMMQLKGTFLFLLFFTAIQLSAQSVEPDLRGGGTLYYVAFPDTVRNAQDARYVSSVKDEFYLYIYSPVDQQVKIGRANGASTIRNVPAGETIEFDTKEIVVPVIGVPNKPQTNVLKVEAERPVILYAYMATRFGCAAFTPIPVEKWGTEYYAASWEGEFVRDIVPPSGTGTPYNQGPKVPAPAEIVVVAAYDNTQVRISPTGPLAACANCQTVKLNAGEAYLVESFVDLNDAVERQSDIAGSSITANKRIGVITGNTRMWHEQFSDGAYAGNSFKDLAVEWIAPTEQHGKEFIFTPTWDDLRQRPEVNPTRSHEYVRLYATTNVKTNITYRNSRGLAEPTESTNIKSGEFSHERIGDLQNAIPYFSTEPAQAYQSPRPVSKYDGAVGPNGAGYLSWGTYMVEMVPREEWGSFAPFVAPSSPVGMKHYVNLVASRSDQSSIYVASGTGSRQPFPFRDTIPGTDLIWGTLTISPGISGVIEGDNGARFGGFVYGSRRGLEVFHPINANLYEEELAMMYAYPLAPSRCVISSPDDYLVKVEDDCGVSTITIEAQNENPAGLAFIRLDPDSSQNVQLQFIEPESSSALYERDIAKAVIRVIPIDPQKEARAVIKFQDRSCDGELYRMHYIYEAESVNVNSLDFGKVGLNVSAGERLVTITNPLDKDVVVRGLGFFFGNQEFVITRTEPNFDWKSGADSVVLKSGESLKVWIDITPRDENRVYHDSLVVHLPCSDVKSSVRAFTVAPCLFVNDLTFGTVKPGVEKTLPLEICNLGSDVITFHDSTVTGGGAFLTWEGTEFKVDPADIEKLKNARLGQSQCVTINVTFSSELDGVFRTTGRFWGSTRDCRDTSVWIARVQPTSGVEEDEYVAGYQINSISPNPFSHNLEIDFRLAKGGMTTVEVYDASGKVVAEVYADQLGSGEHKLQWEAANIAAGAYYIRIQSGEWTVSRQVLLVR